MYDENESPHVVLWVSMHDGNLGQGHVCTGNQGANAGIIRLGQPEPSKPPPKCHWGTPNRWVPLVLAPGVAKFSALPMEHLRKLAARLETKGLSHEADVITIQCNRLEGEES